MCDTFDERNVISEWRISRARAPRRCEACCETIPQGVLYHHFSALYDGSWSHVDQCVRCHAIWLAADAKISAWDEAASLTLDCGVKADPDDAAQEVAFWLPTDQPIRDFADLVRMIPDLVHEPSGNGTPKEDRNDPRVATRTST